MKRALTLFLALLTLCACTPAQQEPDSGNGYDLWFAVRRNSGRGEPLSVAQEAREWDGEPTAQQLMDALLKGPKGESHYNPFPNGTAVRGIFFDEERATVQVDMSEQYGGLAGYDLTVADSCIALTLCQLPGIEHVEVLVAGEPIPYRDRQQIGQGDLLLSGAGEQPENFLMTLYFPNCTGGGLTVEHREVERNDRQAAEILMEELLRGPRDTENCAALPAGTQVLDMTIEDGVCRLDLSRAFLSRKDPERGKADLYALVNSLCALNEINRVRIQVEGETPESYADVSLKNTLTADYDLVR